MVTALSQDRETARKKIRALRRQVLVHDVNRWAESFLDALNHGGIAGSALMTEGEPEPER